MAHILNNWVSAMNDLKVMRMKNVVETTGLCRATIYNRLKDGTFPAPIRLGVKSIGFLASEVNAWIAEKSNARSLTGAQK